MIDYEDLHKLNQSFLADYRKKADAVFDSGRFILGKRLLSLKNNLPPIADPNIVLELPAEWMP